MEDYFCVAKSVRAARTYVEYLGKKFQGENIKISFAQETYDLYESSAIEDYGKRFSVTIVPSILFKSKDNISVIVFNPKLTSNSPTFHMLDLIKSEKTYRIINILYSLTFKFSIHITPKHILEKLDKTDIEDIYLASDKDILELIVDLKYCDNIKEANSKFFNRITLPRLLIPYDELIKKLSFEKELYVVNPDYFISTGKELNFIKGFILNYKFINDNIKNLCLQNGLDLRFGSGRLID